MSTMRLARAAVATLVVLLTAACVAAVFAVVKWHDANASAASARQTAADANSLLFASPAAGLVKSHLDQALLLALEANQFAGTVQARSTMILALEQTRTSGLEGIIGSGSSYPIEAVAFSPDGKTLASGGSAVLLWDLTSRRPGSGLHRNVGPTFGNSMEVNPVWSVAFSPLGKKVASVWSDGTLRLWDLAGGKPRETDLVVPAYGNDLATVQVVAFSADGRTLASGDANGDVRIWSHLTSRKPIGKLLPGTNGVASLAFSPYGKMLALVGSDGKVRLQDLASPKPRGIPLPNSGPASVLSLAFSPNGKTLASSDKNGNVRLWDVAGRNPHLIPAVGVFGLGVAFSPDGKTLATGGGDGKVRLWDLTAGGPLGIPGSVGAFTSVALSPDGKTFASGDKAGKVRLWDLRSLKLLEPLLSGGGSASVTSVAFTPDGKWLAAGDHDGKVRL